MIKNKKNATDLPDILVDVTAFSRIHKCPSCSLIKDLRETNELNISTNVNPNLIN